MPRDPEQQAVADWLASDEGFKWQETQRRWSGDASRHHLWIDFYDDSRCGDHDDHGICGGWDGSVAWWSPSAVGETGECYADGQWITFVVDGSCPLYSAEYRKAKADA